MTNHTYKNNFIDQVIIRYDFVAPIGEFDNGLPIELKNRIISKYPIVEIIKTPQQTNPILGEIFQDAAVYTFQSNERDKLIEIGKSYCAFIFKKFTSFNNIIQEITPINEILFSSAIKISINRIGLRFINLINLPGKNALSWSHYLVKPLIEQLNIIQDKDRYIRIIGVIELKYDDFFIKFQYGMHNPDYPAKILKKLFILDYDAYAFSNINNKVDTDTYLLKFNDAIYDLFEKSIKQGLRERMQ